MYKFNVIIDNVIILSNENDYESGALVVVQ